MTVLTVIRHGQTPWNVEGRYQGQLDPPLNENGRRQAQDTARALAQANITAIYSSDLARAHQTAAALAQLTGLPVELDPRLREIHQGHWQGVLIDDIRARWPAQLHGWETDPWQHCPPGGETLPQLQARLLAAVNHITARHPTDGVAIFTHKLPIALLKIHFHGHPAAAIWSLLPANGAWEIFETTSTTGTQ